MNALTEHRSAVAAGPTRTSTRPSDRDPGPDVVRAVAIFGVIVMNFHGYLIHRGAARDGSPAAVYDLFDPWDGPLATRFAATFALTAGVGVTLLTRSRRPGISWVLARRGLLLYGAGLAFDFVWPGTILPYYGAMFVIAALVWRLRSWAVLAVGAVAALAAFGLRWVVLERQLDGRTTTWLTDPGPRSPTALMVDVFVNGTHPLLPWLAFFCAGIVLGRQLARPAWRVVVAFAGGALFTLATLLGTAATGTRRSVLLGTDPWSRSLVYTASALGTALLAFAAITWLAERWAATAALDFLQRAGQMSLTIYLAHALLFNLLVDWLGLVQPGSIWATLALAFAVWLLALVAAVAYQQRFRRGPAEQLYRALTA